MGKALYLLVRQRFPCDFAHALRRAERPPPGSRFPPLDPVREAGTRTDNAPFTPTRSSPPSVAMGPRVPARSPMGGKSWQATQARRLLLFRRNTRLRRCASPKFARTQRTGRGAKLKGQSG